ncbi:FAD-binding oxidoreductase [Pseudomonas sp. NFXW11]|uniref:NAD(P)/FAD-dependent oxidoreductase n=1 Tax=Pseudomonas sp. NFXW11 TaxID=2819531 RepID=UPI003CEBE6C5
MKGSTVIVVGAGIVGASIAYHLARQGAQVTLLEQGTAACGVTGHSFAWINLADELPAAMQPLRRQALVDYWRLQEELPALSINWSGALSYTEATLEGANAQGAQDSPSVRWLERAQVAQLEPNLNPVPERARYAHAEGCLDPVAATRVLLDGARAHGAQVREGTPVLSLRHDGQRLLGVNTPAGPCHADWVVLAAGCATPALLAPLGLVLPVQASPSILIRIDAPPGLVKTLISSNQMEIREAADGSLLMAEDFIAEAGPQGPHALAQQALATVQQSLRGAAGATLRSVEVGQRPMPQDQLPIIGPSATCPGLYLAVMHSGVTLAASVGRLVSQELLHGQSRSELAPCRPARFD